MQHAAPSLIQEQFLFLNQLNSFYCIVELVYVYTALSFLFIIYLSVIYTHSVKSSECSTRPVNTPECGKPVEGPFNKL